VPGKNNFPPEKGGKDMKKAIIVLVFLMLMVFAAGPAIGVIPTSERNALIDF
jgi:hypothetical protein